MMRDRMGQKRGTPFAGHLEQALADGYTRLLAPSVETDIRVELKQRSDREAVDVFAENLRNLLLAAPMGAKAVIAIDPGLRTGCKCVALSATGKFLGNTTIYIVKGEAALEKAKLELLAFMAKHEAGAVAIGNGTGGRETESFVRGGCATPSSTRSWWCRSTNRVRACTAPPMWPVKSSPSSTSRCAVPFPLGGGCKIRWRSW
jgi:transcriptional accessory protein Tex/SPT6